MAAKVLVVSVALSAVFFVVLARPQVSGYQIDKQDISSR